MGAPANDPDLLAEAEARTGLRAATDASFRPGLDLVSAALADDRVTPGGRSLLTGEFVNYLANRLRIDEQHARRPELAGDQPHGRDGLRPVRRIGRSTGSRRCGEGFAAVAPLLPIAAHTSRAGDPRATGSSTVPGGRIAPGSGSPGTGPAG